jgi:antirestriction protein ArdC
MERPIDALLETFIAMLEAGTPPWRQPWSDGAAGSLPLRADGAPFSGSNCWILASTAAMCGRSSPHWFTFKQALEIGAPVRKGEKGQHVVLFKTRSIDEEIGDGESESRTLRYLRAYTVFNGDQLEGLPDRFRGAPPLDETLREEMRDEVIDAIPAEVIYGGSKAYYSPADDRIRMPPPEVFETPADARATLLHEIGHWSGHASRLDREFGKRFGDDAYAFEEIVVEMAAALLALHLQSPPAPLETHASYLGSWVKILKQRPGALIEASGHAQRAVDFLLAFSRDRQAHAA